MTLPKHTQEELLTMPLKDLHVLRDLWRTWLIPGNPEGPAGTDRDRAQEHLIAIEMACIEVRSEVQRPATKTVVYKPAADVVLDAPPSRKKGRPKGSKNRRGGTT